VLLLPVDICTTSGEKKSQNPKRGRKQKVGGSRGGGDARTEELEGGEGYHGGEGLQEQGRERDDLAPHGAGHRERDQRSHRRLHRHHASQDHPLQRHRNPARLEHSRNFSRQRGREGRKAKPRAPRFLRSASSYGWGAK